jgi:hypothetical protein
MSGDQALLLSAGDVAASTNIGRGWEGGGLVASNPRERRARAATSLGDKDGDSSLGWGLKRASCCTMLHLSLLHCISSVAKCIMSMPLMLDIDFDVDSRAERHQILWGDGQGR